MYKPKRLLKIVSVIIIIFAVITALSLVLLIGTKDTVMEMTGIEVTTASILTSAIAVAIELAVGIIGIASKNFKLTLIAAIIYVGFAVVTCIVNVISLGMTPLSFTGLILPLLYGWGVYQSKE